MNLRCIYSENFIQDEKIIIYAISTLNKEEAFAAIPLATIAADGNISEEEVLGIITALTRMKLFADYDAKKMNSMFNKLIGIIKRQGVDALAMADGILEKAEKDILTKIQQTLEVPEDVAIKIIEVILIKNKG